jgi:hypothetical protein
MFSDVEEKIKKKNKIFFSRDTQCLQELSKQIQLQNHRVLVMWALDCAKLTLKLFETKYPDERRPRTCLELSESWARGKIKMSVAKRAILDSHSVAKEKDDALYGALCHAIGHAGATVHVGTHAIGLPIYELTAIVLKHDKKEYENAVTDKIKFYIERLHYWQENTDKLELEWGGFLMENKKDSKAKTPKIFSMSFASVYPMYIQKAEKKGRTKAEVDEIIFWLTGYDALGFGKQLENEVDFETFFEEAPRLNEHVSLIKGVICGYRVEEIEDDLMRKIRYLDKLVDELAKGKSMDKILRSK